MSAATKNFSHVHLGFDNKDDTQFKSVSTLSYVTNPGVRPPASFKQDNNVSLYMGHDKCKYATSSIASGCTRDSWAPANWNEPEEARKNRELRESQSDPRPIGEKLSCSSLILGTPGTDDEQYRSTCLASAHYKQFIDPVDSERRKNAPKPRNPVPEVDNSTVRSTSWVSGFDNKPDWKTCVTEAYTGEAPKERTKAAGGNDQQASWTGGYAPTNYSSVTSESYTTLGHAHAHAHALGSRSALVKTHFVVGSEAPSYGTSSLTSKFYQKSTDDEIGRVRAYTRTHGRT
eukprot:259061_1